MILKVDQLVKSYGSHQVLKGVSFEIDKPGVYALVGPNGAGKSTLLNTICHLIPKNSGSVEVFSLDHSNPDIFHQVSYMKDASMLYPYLTGGDHLHFLRQVHKTPLERVDEVAQRIGISSYLNLQVKTYSTGMKQKLLLAMALMNQPKLLIMDEPLNGLDPSSIIATRELIRSLSQEGTCVLLSSHSLSEIDLITQQIFFLDGGLVEFEDLALTDKKSEERYRERFEVEAH